MGIFEANEIEIRDHFFIDNRLNPSDLIFVVYLLGDRLKKISLTQTSPSAKCLGSLFGVVNNKLHIDGWSTELGYQDIKGTRFLILSRDNARTYFFVFNTYKKLVISSDAFAGIKSPGKTRLILDRDRLIVDVKEADVYYNDKKIVGHHVFSVFEGASFLTPHYLLEKRPSQWKITVFSDDFTFEPNHVLRQKRKSEFPKDFPDYRRSPRLNLEVPTDKFKLQGSSKHQENKGHSLLKMILPPLMMIGMTGVTTLLSGRDALMMLGMGGASLLTMTFTVSQFFTEKKANKLSAIKEKENDLEYLVTAVGEITRPYKREKEVLAFQLPSPEKLVDMTAVYDSRIYERQVHNKDFLTVSLGTCDAPSSLTIETDVNDKDLSHESKHLKTLAKQFSTQRQVPTAISLLNQTLGLVGAQDVLATSLENLLFQTAFFHSYRDVNFISLLSRKAYQETWQNWRLLPHFKLQELNMRGLVYTEKLRDIVLNAFYQCLIKRKQVLKEAGREKVQFSPHYILTIVDDALLSGHGINELLAEDMSELGVTVIWCKEDANQLPETVVSLVEIPNTTNGQLISDHTVYLAKPFIPYPALPDLAVSLIKLANLNHLEVEKNAVPESLSLLEQYEVKTVEALEIGQRWETAQPNKSIKSLIGWRGKSDYVYWDLHERGHGPHALVGGTTGSGKSEFLTTYLSGLAINFSPEDIGMLIIDWKGGGIANTLDKLPHFMGAITNLDGAGTARALASIKAELDKRQREFARYGVNSINDYMSLYKQCQESKPDVNYPTKPLPHLILVSDEFAELKANVPEFLDELTSVARIGRSLGVHLILATQKPSGVVNDQIEANSRSKIALKMAGVQDSNELLKTPDAAHITNPGRGYLRVGENEVYDLFQSGYAGVPYDPEAENEEKVDERIFSINALGQYELMYDPTEEVVQGKDTSDLPSQLDAVITEIIQIFECATYTRPDQPWLPNLAENIPTPQAKLGSKPTLSVPLGLLDIPSDQAQVNYDFDLLKQGNTVIFASSGYGKSTLLQTLSLNLARANTPEQVHLNLLDFGNNGLLPLKDLPHVADIVTLEETEKLQKMLAGIVATLASRKRAFKTAGVASLEQYEAKTQLSLPIIVNLLDNYDGLSLEDSRKQQIDNALLQVLREGPSLGVYLVLTASRLGAVRANMMSAIPTKLVLYLNDAGEVTTIMGRASVQQEAKAGRGQVMLDVPRAIQFYLPVVGVTSTALLENLEQTVSQLDQNWTETRPAKIPMVPEELTGEVFETFIPVKEANTLYLGLDKLSAEIVTFSMFKGNAFGLFMESNKQANLILPRLLQQITSPSTAVDKVLIDASGNLKVNQTDFNVYIDVSEVNNQSIDLKASIGVLLSEKLAPTVVVVNGLEELNGKLVLTQEELLILLNGSNEQLQFIFIDSVEKVGNSFGGITTLIKENIYHFLFGGDLRKQRFIENISLDKTKIVPPRYVLHQYKDETFGTVNMPMEQIK